MQPHKVYLSWTSGPKVGITRADRLWRRWADQGAVCAIELAQVPTRRAAGVVEAALKHFVADRTDWRRLVTQPRQVEEVRPSMLALAQRLRSQCDELGSLSTDHLHTRLDLSERAAMSWVDHFELRTLVYPGQSRTVAKRLQCQSENALVQGRLIGAVGHFLLLDTGVVDVWSHASEQVEVTALDVDTNQTQDSHQGSLF